MKFLIWILAITGIAVAALFAGREIAGWNDGMQQPRSEVHAAVWQDRIYVAGGIGLFRTLDSCEYYQIAKQTWQSCPDLPRALHHVALAADAKHIYASGGYDSLPFNVDTDAALFALDPVKGTTWDKLAKLPHPIGQHAMLYYDGMLFLIGGKDETQALDTLWTYDLARKKWSKRAPMPTARHSHAIAVAGDKLYVTGGRSAELGTEIDVVEAYDFTNDSWERLPSMPTGRGGHGAFVREGKLHIIGGESLTDRALIPGHEILDLFTGTWSSSTALAKPRHGFAVGDAANSNNVYIIAGGAKPGMQTIYSVTGTTQIIAP